MNNEGNKDRRELIKRDNVDKSGNGLEVLLRMKGRGGRCLSILEHLVDSYFHIRTVLRVSYNGHMIILDFPNLRGQEIYIS